MFGIIINDINIKNFLDLSKERNAKLGLESVFLKCNIYQYDNLGIIDIKPSFPRISLVFPLIAFSLLVFDVMVIWPYVVLVMLFLLIEVIYNEVTYRTIFIMGLRKHGFKDKPILLSNDSKVLKALIEKLKFI